LMEVDTAAWTESTVIEVNATTGKVLKRWTLADIVSAAMGAGGDDPAQFVFPSPIDWFHNNACAYRASDDTLIVSGREDFVIALDYDTGKIKWILGDTTKHWYQFPSLQAFALALGPDTLPPIGEHAISIVADQLLLFDNGTGSLTQQPPGETRTYSAPRKYSIVGNTATEVYHYLINPPIQSSFCSSVYEDATDNYLIDYTQAQADLSSDLVALDATGSIAFYYRYVANGCGSAFYADPIHLENMQFN
jgi:arylsulfate sulfotransferase